MVADLEVKRKAENAEREAREKLEREAAIKEEEEREAKEKAAEAAELERKAARKREAAGKQANVKPAAPLSAAAAAAAAKAHLLARDEAEGFAGPPTKVTKEDAAEGASWAHTGGFFVFLCNDSTEDECYARALFGAPAKFWDVAVDHVKPGTTLVLYNFAARTLSGPYEALAAPGWNELAGRVAGRTRRAARTEVRLLPIRPRSRGARRSLRTFPVVTLHSRFPFNV